MKNKIINFIKTNKFIIVLVLILVFGFSLRLIGINLLPTGLNVDEASARL